LAAVVATAIKMAGLAVRAAGLVVLIIQVLAALP
jgi:hypothetical protein